MESENLDSKESILSPAVIITIVGFIIFAIILGFIYYVYIKASELVEDTKAPLETILKPIKKIGRGLKQFGKSKLPICKKPYYKSAGLCYKPCKKGYKKSGLICYQTCPRGWRNDGVFCKKPREYTRGAGYPWKFGDKPFSLNAAEKRCKKKHKQGCEKNGLIYYQKCKKGFKNVGCCICSPRCQKGMTDWGVSCAKKQYGGGVGIMPKYCKKGYFFKAGLCYPRNV